MKPIYKASDGSEQRLLAASALTADGQPLEFGRSRDYWYVTPSFIGMPRLGKMYFWPSGLRVDMDYAGGALTLREYCHERKEYVSRKICELYADERKAKEALLAACEQRIAEWNEELAKIRKDAQ